MGNGQPNIVTTRQAERQQEKNRVPSLRPARAINRHEELLREEIFHAMLTLERRRAERSSQPFVLMLLDVSGANLNGSTASFVERLTASVSSTIRESDLVGWYQENAVLAVIFTELNFEGDCPITEVLHAKIRKFLCEDLGEKLISKVVISVHIFPESWDEGRPDRTADIKLYPDLSRKAAKKRAPMILKRVIDVVVSGALLLLLSPILALIALAIKLTSDGPVIFKQERLGQFGSRFNFLKFRTMHANNDPKIHQEYIQRYIAGQAGRGNTDAGQPVVYKITNDPRVTAVGRFLRKTSLDELPQFWNVLKGDMSLVGPRPPVQYEFENYDAWHRRRVLEVRPGITGLWQVTGRSRTSFDDMVRLDLRYTQTWSLWLDLKILLATPRAVLTGEGAY